MSCHSANHDINHTLANTVDKGLNRYMMQDVVEVRFYCHRPLSKEMRGRYGKGGIDAKPTVIVACALYVA